MMRTSVCVVLVLGSLCHAAELWVDGSAAPGGDGSQAKPMQTINAAVNAAAGGDVITIRKGTYAESIAISKSGTADRPTTIRAAAGERVILSGFAPISGWQPHRDKIFTTTVDGTVEELFVGYAMQSVSRWPGVNEPWRYIKTGDPGTIGDTKGLANEKALAEVAAAPAGARLYLYVGAGNFFNDAPLTKLDLASGTLSSSQTRTLERLKGQRDRYQIINHVSLIKAPGQWAAEPLDGKRTRLYFWPAEAGDLQRTQYRKIGKPLLNIGHWKNTVSHVRAEGLEVTGGGAVGIDLGRAEHVVITRCIAHHNAGNGIAARRCGFIEISNNISVGNGMGVGIASSHDVTVQQNEIALNMVDGLVVAGNVSGRPDAEPTTKDVLVRRNYLHHHLLLGHPDNMQTYRGVEGLKIEENLHLWGGQGLMTEETDHSSLRNSIVFGTGAVAVIFGHSNASDWTVEGCTIGLGGWGALSLTGKNYRIDHNIFYHNGHGLGETVTADYNLFVKSSDSQAIANVTKPKWKSYTAIEELAAATGQQKHSIVGDPGFISAPARQAMAIWHDENTPDRLHIRPLGKGAATEGFAAGDRIEINGDGVLRRIVSVDEKSLRFEPPLPQVPLRDGLIWNWKNAPHPILDLRPRDPAAVKASDGGRMGASIDIPAYQRGDFDGDGKRDLPEIPEDLKAAWPNPNAIALPMHGA